MRRFFLSGQATCAMLLGAGLLMRAQAALRSEPEAAPVAIETPRTRPAEMAAPRVRVVRAERSSLVRRGKRISHSRKGFTHRLRNRHLRRRGVAVAGPDFQPKAG
jgi:hypothetical protein